MKIIKKIDDVGRIAIPKDIRRALRWMGGDEIEIQIQEEGTVLLKKHEDYDDVARLFELKRAWAGDAEIDNAFNELISLIEDKN